MKLSVDFSGLEQALKQMGGKKADIQQLRHTVKRDTSIQLSPIEWQGDEVVLEGFKDIQHVILDPSGCLTLDNEQITLHILEPYKDTETLLHSIEESPRFHFTECKTINHMKASKRFDRYVATKSIDSYFNVRPLLDIDSRERGSKISIVLLPCRLCLQELNYLKYNEVMKSKKDEIVFNFEIKEFFKQYKPSFKEKPTYTENTMPLGTYGSKWPKISKKKRESNQWTCDCCGVKCHENKELLHTHHKDGIIGNNKPSNLQALCALCHAAQPLHKQMKINSKTKQKIQQLRLLQIIPKTCKNCQN